MTGLARSWLLCVLEPRHGEGRALPVSPGGEEGLRCWALAREVMAFVCLRRLDFHAGLAPPSQLLPGVCGLVTDPRVSCLSPTLEQMGG